MVKQVAHGQDMPASQTSVAQREDRWWSSLFELLEHRARTSPGRSFYVRDGRGVQEFRTLSQLLASSHRVAFALKERGVGPGDPVLVAQPTSFDFLSTFFGIQALGAIPIPLNWPGKGDVFKGISKLARWRRIAIRYGARVLICGDLGSRADQGWRGIWPPHPLEVVTDTARLLEGVPSRVEVEPHRASFDDVAYIQSTSGTTGPPRGVKLTHRGIYTNVEAIRKRIDARDDDVLVSWLPPDNIMGLVGVVFFSLHCQVRPVLMHPEQFLAHPEDWFWAISDHRATLSLAPNFAFNYCVRRCNESDLEGLDLSSWRIAMNGSEPVRAQHMQAFARRFHRYGFGDHVLMPVYGLSEATSGVTFHPRKCPIRVDGINRRDLEWEGKANPLPSEGADCPYERMHVVSVGQPLDGMEVRIVDDQAAPVADRVLGEIAIRGPNLMSGYVESTLRDGEPLPTEISDGWLLTGDLGYLSDGDLFFISRASEQITLEGGRVIFPEEVEFFVDAVDGVRSGSTAVFSTAPASESGSSESGQEESSLVVAFEVQAGTDSEELIQTITSLLKLHLDLDPDLLIDLPTRSVPKTPTGKVRRHHCRRLLQKNNLGRRGPQLLDFSQFEKNARDLGDTLQAGGASIVHRLKQLVTTDDNQS